MSIFNNSDSLKVGSSQVDKVYLGASQIWTSVPPALYEFSSFTFTDAGQGSTSDVHLGPTLAECLSAYDTVSNPWLLNTSFFNVATQGYQEWTVPETASYRVVAAGAKGGDYTNTGPQVGGNGARIEGTFQLTEGDIYRIVVGQRGRDSNQFCFYGGGGGGGSFVVKNSGTILNSSTSDILVIAGGGGGAATADNPTNKDGQTTTSGGPSYDQYGSVLGGNNGTGGDQGSGCAAGALGGSGFRISRGNGQGYIYGSQGGISASIGGFGGGGYTANYCGGGGGGYSGGAGGGIADCSCASLVTGGGGGSYNAGSNQANYAGGNSSTGYVVITKL